MFVNISLIYFIQLPSAYKLQLQNVSCIKTRNPKEAKVCVSHLTLHPKYKTLINDLLLPLEYNIYIAFGKSQSMIKVRKDSHDKVRN